MTLKWKSEFLAKKNNSLNVVYWHVVGILTWPAICCAARSFFNPVHYADNAVFFAELSRVNAMNPAKHTRIAMKIWTYTSENGKKNCMGRDWIFAEKQIIITRLLARIFWENSHQKSLFILERLNLHSTRPLENPENLLDSFITILNTPFFYKMGRT